MKILSKVNNLNNNLIFKIKKVIYSALLGNYDSLKKFIKQEDFDYFLFTDILIKKQTNWTIIKIPDIVINLNMDIIKKQRFIKLHPHIFFKNYYLSLYVDSNFIIFGNINEFLQRILIPKINIYVFEHPKRNCIYSEIKAVIKLKKEKQKIAFKLRNRYENIKFPKKIGLSENCLLVRIHNKKDCIYLMEKWWKEIEYYSYRDQLSFNYIKWKTKIKIKYISKSFALEYFKKTKHLNSNI